jgi:hypothetical protein
MGSMRRGWPAVRPLPLLTTTRTGGAVVALTPASQAASAGAKTSLTAATSRVTAPGISAPADVVARAADGSAQLDVTSAPPGGNPVAVNHRRHQ